MKIENTKNSTEVVFNNNNTFIGLYIVPLFVLVSFIFSKVTVQTVIMNLIFFIFLSIGNYIVMRDINSTETITLKNTSLVIRKLKKNKKIIYEKEIFYDEIFKVYYQKFFLDFYKRNFNFDMKRTLKIKTYLNIYSFGYKMSYEDFLKVNLLIEEKIKEYKLVHKDSIEKREYR